MSRRSATPLIIGTLVLRINSGAVTVVLGLFLAELANHAGHHITSVQVGLLPTAFFISEIVLAPLMGALGDRWGRRYFLIFGPIPGLIEVSLFPFTPTTDPLPYLLALQVLGALSSAMIVPATLSYLADLTVEDREGRPRLMGFYELATTGGIAIGVAVGGFAWAFLGPFAFGLIAFFYLLVAACMVLAPRAKQVIVHDTLKKMVERYWALLRTPSLFLFIPAWISISALAGIWLSSQLSFLLSMHRHDPNQVLIGSMSGHGGGIRLSLVLAFFVLFFGLCLLFWAFFMNRVPRLRLMLISIAGVYLACFALAGINHRGEGNNLVLVVWVPLLMLGIFAESSFAPAALAYLADVSERAARDRGLVMGLYSIFLGLGQSLGNGVGGIFAHSFGFDGLIYLTALLAFIALISLLWLFRQEKRNERRPAAPDVKVSEHIPTQHT
jgi:MFS family permease